MIEIRGKNFVAYNASESVLESIIKDVFTGAMLGVLCVYQPLVSLSVLDIYQRFDVFVLSGH